MNDLICKLQEEVEILVLEKVVQQDENAMRMNEWKSKQELV